MNRKTTTTVLYIAILLAVNVWIVARVFRTEYTPHMGSIEGAFVGISRWWQGNWSHTGWFPLWYCGIPVEESYPPLLHWLVAFASTALGLSVVRAHHVVTAGFYCLGSVAMFWLVWRLTQSRWKGFVAGWIYSLLSPSAFLMRSVRVDLGTVWGARRIQNLLFYGEGPHITAMTLLLVALAAMHAALEYEIGWWTVAAVLATAAVALTNWLGAMALVWGVLALAMTRKQARLGRIVLIGVLAYAIAMPWLPPTDIATVRRNAQIVGGQTIGFAQFLYLAAWLAAALVIARRLRKSSIPEGNRFALVFLFIMAVPTLGFEWFHVYPLPQPDRYRLEMEAAVVMALGIALASGKLASKWPRAVVAALLLCLAIAQVPRWRTQIRGYLPPFDVTKTVEWEQALWLQNHYPGQRVYVTGSTRFWFNAFADNPQLDGDFDQGETNQTIRDATFAVTYLKGNGQDTVALLKAYGVRAFAVGGQHSRDAYKDYDDPGKFAGVVPEVWRDGGDAIYEIPGSGSLAHVVNKEELVTTGPLDWPAIRRFAAAIDHDDAAGDARAQMIWNGPNRVRIQAGLNRSQIVSVQVSWDQGWRASINGVDLALQRDALGFIALEPGCDGRCAIDLVYDGGAQKRISDLICLLGFGACGLLVYRGLKRRRV